MEHTIKVFSISPRRLKEDLEVIKEESFFPHFQCVLNDRETVKDMEKIAKSLAMQAIFIFKQPNRIICSLSW